MVKVLIAVDASEQAEKAYNCEYYILSFTQLFNLGDLYLSGYMKNFHKDGNEVIILHSGEAPKLPTISFAGRS